MQVVINISKKKYNEIKEWHIITYGDSFVRDLIRRIKNGTPLPEHHGRLIDADAIQKHQVDTYGQELTIIDAAPTILEGNNIS